MTKRKTKLMTLTEHAALGRRLHRLRMEIMAIGQQLQTTYPKTSKSVCTARKLCRMIDTLRCEMDDRVYREHPGEADSRIYYCGGETSGSVSK